jgi:hypothetical protein
MDPNMDVISSEMMTKLAVMWGLIGMVVGSLLTLLGYEIKKELRKQNRKNTSRN